MKIKRYTHGPAMESLEDLKRNLEVLIREFPKTGEWPVWVTLEFGKKKTLDGFTDSIYTGGYGKADKYRRALELMSKQMAKLAVKAERTVDTP